MRFPEFSGEWVEKCLSELMTFKNGLNASKDDYGSGYKFINVLDIINNDFIKHDSIIGSVNVKEADFQKNIVEYGDILFQRSSETREEVGQANVYIDKETPATFGGFVIRGKKKADYNPVFLNYLLKTASARKEITSKSGGSTRYNVGQETLSSVKINTTIIAEQNKIASLLTKIEARISTQSKIIEHQESLMKGLMQQISSQQLRFKDNNGYNYPDWEVEKLKDICEKGASNISANALESNSGEYKIYGATGYLQNVEFYQEKEAYISIVKDGAGAGRTLICEAKSSVLGTLDKIKPKNNNNLYFLYLLLKTINFEKYITGSTIPHIYFRDYGNEKIKLPCIEEQAKIAHFISSLDEKLEKERQILSQYKQQKKHLLQNLFF